jgi:hypothetical protein
MRPSTVGGRGAKRTKNEAPQQLIEHPSHTVTASLPDLRSFLFAHFTVLAPSFGRASHRPASAE